MSQFRNIFPGFHDSARVWIYPFCRRLDKIEVKIVFSSLAEFVADWKSHQVDVRGDFLIAYDQFVLMAGESENGISGCSIDSSVRVFKQLKERYGLDALDRSLVFYRDREEIRAATRQSFHGSVTSGRVPADTLVFNNAVQTVGEIRSGVWELPFSRSWHAVEFRIG